MTEQYHIQDRENVSVNGESCVSFKMFESRPDLRATVFVGQYFCPVPKGKSHRDVTDKQCLRHALIVRNDDDDEFNPAY